VFRWIRTHPQRTLILAFFGFILWTLPQGVAVLWPIFTRKTVPEWAAERAWPGMTPTVYGWVTVALGVAMLAVMCFAAAGRRAAPSRPIPPPLAAEDVPRASESPPTTRPPQPPTVTPSRIYVTKNPEELTADLRKVTSLLAEGRGAPYLGKWIKVAGPIENVARYKAPSPNDDALTVFMVWGQSHVPIHLWFGLDTWRSHLEILGPGDVLSAEGRIETLNDRDMRLMECAVIELSSVPVSCVWAPSPGQEP
jgi:hypothetical protein